ncbi:MAG TPA: GyrI-like domain-containing protein [Thermoleophilia bacterium]|nr:GyrI-like domain-containing protein [Thermoleophilia bacterium]
MYDVDMVMIPEEYVAYLHTTGPISGLRDLMTRLYAALDAAGVAPAGPPMARFFDAEFDPEKTEFEVCVPIAPGPDGSIPDAIGEAQTDLIPAHQAMVTAHRGPYSTAHLSYEALSEELNRFGYAVAGPATEVFLTGPESTSDPNEYVTEVRMPVTR